MTSRPGPYRTHDVTLPDFSGPLELLLNLIEKRELDISRVSLLAVTDQYIARLHEADFDPDQAADFLVIAGRLLLLKSISLLPPIPGQESADDDPGEELTQMLMEYKRLKELAQDIRRLEERGLRSYPRPAPLAPDGATRPLAPVTADRLLSMLERALARQPQAPEVEAPAQTVTIEMKMELIRTLLRQQEQVAFELVLDQADSRLAVILSFLALLELLKRAEAEARQETRFGPIVLVRLDPAAAPATDESAAPDQ